MLRRFADMFVPFRLMRPSLNRGSLRQGSIPYRKSLTQKSSPRLLRAAAWAGGAGAVGAALSVPDLQDNWRQSRYATRLSYLFGNDLPQARARLDQYFADRDGTFYGVRLVWESPHHASIQGDSLQGSIVLQEGWVKLDLRVEGFLRLHSKTVHRHVTRRFHAALERD